MYELIIRGGTVVDGTGGRRYRADIAVSDGIIVKIAENINEPAGQIIDAQGKIVSPGFIDSHSHADLFIMAGTNGYNYLEQGTTTEICGPCGESPMPYFDGVYRVYQGIVPDKVMDYMVESAQTTPGFMQRVGEMPLGTNMGFLVGQGTIRGRVMGFEMGEPTEAQLDEMRAYVQQAMDCGCLGISSGLIYPPSAYAGEAELIELAKVAACSGGIYSSHIRGEDERSLESVAEAIRVAKAAGLPLVISHHKMMGKRNEGLSKRTLDMVEQANARGHKVRVDQYPFLAGSSGLIDSIPPKYRADGVSALVERLKDKEFRKQVTADLCGEESDFENFYKNSGFEGFLVMTAPAAPQYVGKTIARIAEEKGVDPFDMFYDVLIEANGAVVMVYFSQNEDDMMRILSSPFTMPGSDLSHNPAEVDPETLGGWHPRATCTMTRHLQLIRRHGLMSLEAAIHRMTAMPAEFYGLIGRGLLAEGHFADICIFDYDAVAANADFMHPYRRNEGIETVIVNGKIAVVNGRFNGTKAGRVMLRGRA